MGCEVRWLRLPRGHCRGFRDVSLLAEGSHRAHLLLAFPPGLAVVEPWYLVSKAARSLDLVWAYGQRFCCEQLYRDQKSGIFHLESSGLRELQRIDPHWQRGLSFVSIGFKWLQQCVANTSNTLLAWAPIPLRNLEPWFTRIVLPPRPPQNQLLAVP
jgi:hypothetical protein